jgi:hypothetical protein
MSNFSNDYVENPLWTILVEVVHALIMYKHHKAYVREVILSEKPEITAQELAGRLGIPLGEALVILYELKKEKEQNFRA